MHGQAVSPDGAPDKAAFVLAVRDATARYRDRQAAVSDGYRKIGPDFPGMGEHWISVPLLLEGGLDPRRPPILEYAMIDGAPTLVGAAFAVLLQPGESPPSAGLPVDRAAWHYHGGTVSEESFVLGHAQQEHGSPDKPRVAVLHVWAWLDNPAGPFATDNWALPYLRLGLEPPTDPPRAATAHALALAAGGVGYYEALVGAAGGEPARATPLLQAAAADVRILLDRQAVPAAAARWMQLRDEVSAATGVMLP
jgi:hypothetical protein